MSACVRVERWCDEAQKWAPSLQCLRFHPRQADTLLELPCFADYDIVVTNYETVGVPYLKSLWSRQTFNLLILDEGHRIKNADTNLAHAVRRVHAECRIILTG